MQRLHWKEGVLSEIEDRIGALPVPLPKHIDPDADKYLPVLLHGEMGEQTLRVLVSTRDTGAGYRLISAFQTEQGSVLLDRGYISVSQNVPSQSVKTLSVTGNLHWPDDRNSATPENDVASNTWFARDIDQMAQYLNTRPILVVARNITPPEPNIIPMPVTSEGIPNNHLEYAMTWFLMAATWVVMTGFAVWRMKR